MYYLRLYMKGCRYLTLNNIESIDIDLTNPMQILIGCNGSGKSTVLSQLAHIVGEAGDYHKNGAKIVELKDNDVFYVISADFSRTKTHSFLKDGEELNPSGKVTVQKELISQEFGLDDEVIKMMLGKLKITDMGPNKRKEWITRMSDVDMTYALQMHRKVATETRDLKGTLSYLGGRIATMSKKLSDILGEEVESLNLQAYRDEIAAATDELGVMTVGQDKLKSAYEHLQGVFRNLGVLASDHELLDKELLRAQKHLSVVPESYEILSQRIQETKDEMLKLTTLSNELSEQECDLEEKAKELGTGVDRVVIEEQIESLPVQIEQLSAQRRFDVPVAQCIDVDWNAARSELLEALSDLPDNTQGRLTRKQLVSIREQLDQLHDQIGGLQNKLGGVRLKIRQMDAVKEINCPECKYSWKEGVDPKEREALASQEETLSKEMTSLKEKQQQLHEQRNSIEEYVQRLSRLIDLKNRYPLQSYIDKITEGGHISDSHDQLYAWANDWADSGLTGLLIDQLNHKLKDAKHNWELLERRDGDEQERLKKIKDKLDGVGMRYRRARREHEELLKYGELIEREQTLRDHLSKGINDANQTYLQVIEALKASKLRQVIYEHNQTISVNEGQQREIDGVKDVLDDLTRSKDEMEVLYDRHKLLTAWLSPTQGIIARSIGGFLNHVTEQMNHILDQIFTYDLSVMPCKFEADGKDLDYRFPLVVGAGTDPSVDIKTASDGQAEIIDFAFRLVALRQLGFAHYPLFLDELGRTLDEQHRNNSMAYLKLLVDGGVTHQVFLISHYASNHGSFLHADVCVLNSTNITVPDKANEHVVFE